MNTSRRISLLRKAAACGCSLGLALALLPASALCAAPKKAKAEAKPATAKMDANDPGYEQWLKKYGAYDRVPLPADDSASDGSGASPLRRAEAQLLQGAPQQAIAILEGQQPYADQAQEIQRLWLGGRAFRALGDPYKAVVWFSQAATLMEPAQVKARLTAEPGLDALWVDVWRRQFWAYVGNPSASREALENTLRTLLAQAEAAWGPENFWVKSKEALAQAKGEAVEAPAKAEKAEKPAKPSKDDPLSVSAEDRLRVAQALSAASLENYAKAHELLGGIKEPALREFWASLLGFLEAGKAPEAKALAASGFAKAAGFWNANLLAAYSANRGDWFLGSASPAWSRFKSNIHKLGREDAQALVDKELNSLLISDEMARLLRSVTFALSLEAGDAEGARGAWDSLDKRRLPLSLRLAGALAYQEDLKNILPQEIGAATKLSPALGALLAAGGLGAPLAGEAPFWTRMEVGRSSSVNKVWPLDRLLVLADWQARWAAGPGPEIARRSAFLFPDTAYGYDCLLYLAKGAVENRSFQLASTYLARLGQLSADKTQQMARLSLKAKMERDSGRDEEALATYKDILALGVDLDTRTRLDMATFLQLKNDFEGGRTQLLTLWEQRDKLPRAQQAEVLFWLGEGEHSLRNYDAALDYYLRLAYQYPQEPMWPTAALYRSAMIYEIKGNFEPAKKLLQTVINQADTKEAKEAARNRLSALEAKSGKPAAKESGEPLYPF